MFKMRKRGLVMFSDKEVEALILDTIRLWEMKYHTCNVVKPG